MNLMPEGGNWLEGRLCCCSSLYQSRIPPLVTKNKRRRRKKEEEGRFVCPKTHVGQVYGNYKNKNLGSQQPQGWCTEKSQKKPLAGGKKKNNLLYIPSRVFSFTDSTWNVSTRPNNTQVKRCCVSGPPRWFIPIPLKNLKLKVILI